MGELSGKIAIVTGSSSGIGRAIAEGLARKGATVVVHYARSADKAQAVVAGIEAAGGRAIALPAELGDVAAIRRLFAEASERLGGLDIVVNNAGVADYKPLTAVTEEDFAATFDVNARGTFFALQEAARRVREGGRIISISTGATVGASPYASIYCGSKAAISSKEGKAGASAGSSVEWIEGSISLLMGK